MTGAVIVRWIRTGVRRGGDGQAIEGYKQPPGVAFRVTSEQGRVSDLCDCPDYGRIKQAFL